MSGRAKGKLFVIRGKERLDVGLQEDEFLLQAVLLYGRPEFRLPAVHAGAASLANLRHCRQQSGLNRLPAVHVGAAAGKALSHRLTTPTGRPKPPAGCPCWRPAAGKAHLTVVPRQQAGPNPACRPSMLAPPAGKALSHRRATPTGRPESRLPAVHVGAAPAGKTLRHRLTTPTGRPESRPAAVHVGASPPATPYATAVCQQADLIRLAAVHVGAPPLEKPTTVGPRQQAGSNPVCRPPVLAPPPSKPYPTAGPRQQAGPNPVCRPSMLAPLRRQRLMPPLGHANRPSQIPPGSRPCWRPPLANLSHRRTTLTGRPESRLPGAHVGVVSPPTFYTEIYKPNYFAYILTVMV